MSVSTSIFTLSTQSTPRRSHHSISSYLITSVENFSKNNESKRYKNVHTLEHCFCLFHCDCLPDTHTALTHREWAICNCVILCNIAHTNTHSAYNVHMIASLRSDTNLHTIFLSLFFCRRVKNFSKHFEYETGSANSSWLCLCTRCFGDLLCFICSNADNSKYNARHKLDWCQVVKPSIQSVSQPASQSVTLKYNRDGGKVFFVYKTKQLSRDFV